MSRFLKHWDAVNQTIEAMPRTTTVMTPRQLSIARMEERVARRFAAPIAPLAEDYTPPVDSLEDAIAKLAAWQSASSELAALERALGEAMVEYAQTLGDPPRALIIAAEHRREDVRRLFDIAMEALDAVSVNRTGHTDFGNLR